MSVDGLRKYIISTPSTRERIQLREFAFARKEKTGKEPELLCDFLPVVSWVLSAFEYSLIETGKQSPYSLLYGSNMKSYGARLLSFVKAIRSIGLKLVFFIEGCTICQLSDDILFETYLVNWRKKLLECANILQVCSGNCELSEICWSLREGMVDSMASLLELTDGVKVICCAGKVLNDAIPYLQSNKNACGILTLDTSYAVAPSCGLFLLDLFGLDMHHPAILPFEPDQDLNCEVVCSSLLASSLDLEIEQLADLAILCGNDFSSLLNSKLRLWNTLGIADPSITTIANWISSQMTSLSSNKDMKGFLMQNPCYELAMKQSYQVYQQSNLEVMLGEGLLACKSKGMLSAKMISLVKYCIYLRPVLLEPETIHQPRFCDATLSIRKFIYALKGLSQVTEVGLVTSTTNVIHRREPIHIPVEVSWVRAEEDGASQLSFISDLSKSVRFAILFHGVVSSQYFLEGRDQFNQFLSRCVDDGQALHSSNDASAAAIVLSSLIFMKSSNSRLSPSPGLCVCELEAILVTCLTTLAGLPSCDYPDLPSAKAITISSRFSHVIDQVYWLASCLGLSHGLPPQDDMFSSCAYISFHHTCSLYKEDAGGVNLDHFYSTRPQLKRQLAIYKNIWELAPVLELRAMILKEASSTLSRITELYTASIYAITSCKTLMDLANPGSEKAGDNDKGENEVIRKESWSPVAGTYSSLLDVDDTILCTSESLPSLGRSELSYSMECNVMEEDHYYSSHPLPENGMSRSEEPVISDNDSEGDERKENIEVEGLVDGDKESSSERKEMTLKVTVDSILNLSSDSSRGEVVPIAIDDEGRKTVQVDSVLINVSDSAESITRMKLNNKKSPPVVNEDLPIMEHRSKILELVRDHSVICIEGETGCGKSTKVPQFVLDEAQGHEKPTYYNIIVTQPRRVAAVTLAERVAAERGERVGKTVGYCVSGCHHRAPQTKLTYCTVGYFLQILIHQPTAIQWYTHVILDEVHERSIDTDFALLIVRKIVCARKGTKVIVMSATMQGDLLTKYFEERFHFSLVASPYFVGAKRFPVREYFIDEVGELADSCVYWDKQQEQSCKFLRSFASTLPVENLQKCMKAVPRVTDHTSVACTHLIISQGKLGEAILVFLPGIVTISKYCEQFLEHVNSVGLADHFKVFILHSQVPFEDQKEAFFDPTPDVVHIILATNIAESSITLPKLRMVINFGIYHQLQYIPKRRTSFLKKRWCSRASCAQRAGRTGRVFDGVVVHLFTRRFYKFILSTFDPPEILTAPLAKLMLQAKMIGKRLGEPSPSKFISEAIEYPPMEQMQVALRDLVELGAIASSGCKDCLDEEADITLLGFFCLSLPVELALCRLVLFSVFFGIPLEGIVIAASLSLYQDIFSLPSRAVMRSERIFLQKLKSSTTSRVAFDKGHYSDAIQICNLFRKWIEFRNANLCCFSMVSKFSLVRSFCLNTSVRWERLLQLESSVVDIVSKVLNYLPDNHAMHAELLNLVKLMDHRKDPCIRMNKGRRSQYSEVHVQYCEDVIVIKALMVASFSNQLLIGKRALATKDSKTGKEARAALDVMKHWSMDPAQSLVMHNLPQPSIPSLHFLALSVLPDRHCNVMVNNNMGFVSLIPKFGSNPMTSLMIQKAAMRGEHMVDPETKNSPWNPSIMETSVVKEKLSPDMIYLWQYGERRPLWSIGELQDKFTKPSNPYTVCWKRMTLEGEKAYSVNWRQPSGSLTDVTKNMEEEDCYLAVAATMQGYQYSDMVTLRDITVLPNSYGDCCSSLLLVLAFQPPTASVRLKLHGHIVGMNIENHYINFNSSQFLTCDDIVRINALRKSVSTVLSSCSEDEDLFPMEEVAKIHSLLDCVLRRRPENLVLKLPDLSQHHIWDTVDFRLNCKEHHEMKEDFEGLSDSDGEENFIANNRYSNLSSFCFYPPMNLTVLKDEQIREIAQDQLRQNPIFCSDVCSDQISSPLLLQSLRSRERESPDSAEFRLSPFAKSFVPLNSVSKNTHPNCNLRKCAYQQAMGGSNEYTEPQSDLASSPFPSNMLDRNCTSDKEEKPRVGSEKVLSSKAELQPDVIAHLALFRQRSTSSNNTTVTSLTSPTSQPDSFDVSHLHSFFPAAFPGFGPVHSLSHGHLNPSVILQVNNILDTGSCNRVDATVHKNLIEYQLPNFNMINVASRISQIHLKQCFVLFGEMLMSCLRLMPVTGPSSSLQATYLTSTKETSHGVLVQPAIDWDGRVGGEKGMYFSQPEGDVAVRGGGGVDDSTGVVDDGHKCNSQGTDTEPRRENLIGLPLSLEEVVVLSPSTSDTVLLSSIAQGRSPTDEFLENINGSSLLKPSPLVACYSPLSSTSLYSSSSVSVLGVSNLRGDVPSHLKQQQQQFLFHLSDQGSTRLRVKEHHGQPMRTNPHASEVDDSHFLMSAQPGNYVAHQKLPTSGSAILCAPLPGEMLLPRYTVPTYISPPAFSLMRSASHRREPLITGGMSGGKKKGTISNENMLRKLSASCMLQFRSRYQHPPWISGMLSAPNKVHPSHIYEFQDVSHNLELPVRKMETTFSAEDPKVLVETNYIPPVGSIWNDHTTISSTSNSKQNRNKKHLPRHLQYGIPDDMVVLFFCHYLRAIGGECSMNNLCGPVYSMCLFSVCSTSSNPQDRLSSMFFAKYHEEFSIYSDQGESMVCLRVREMVVEPEAVREAMAEEVKFESAEVGVMEEEVRPVHIEENVEEEVTPECANLSVLEEARPPCCLGKEVVVNKVEHDYVEVDAADEVMYAVVEEDARSDRLDVGIVGEVISSQELKIIGCAENLMENVSPVHVAMISKEEYRESTEVVGTKYTEREVKDEDDNIRACVVEKERPRFACDHIASEVPHVAVTITEAELFQDNVAKDNHDTVSLGTKELVDVNLQTELVCPPPGFSRLVCPQRRRTACGAPIKDRNDVVFSPPEEAGISACGDILSANEVKHDRRISGRDKYSISSVVAGVSLAYEDSCPEPHELDIQESVDLSDIKVVEPAGSFGSSGEVEVISEVQQFLEQVASTCNGATPIAHTTSDCTLPSSQPVVVGRSMSESFISDLRALYCFGITSKDDLTDALASLEKVKESRYSASTSELPRGRSTVSDGLHAQSFGGVSPISSNQVTRMWCTDTVMPEREISFDVPPPNISPDKINPANVNLLAECDPLEVLPLTTLLDENIAPVSPSFGNVSTDSNQTRSHSATQFLTETLSPLPSSMEQQSREECSESHLLSIFNTGTASARSSVVPVMDGREPSTEEEDHDDNSPHSRHNMNEEPALGTDAALLKQVSSFLLESHSWPDLLEANRKDSCQEPMFSSNILVLRSHNEEEESENMKGERSDTTESWSSPVRAGQGKSDDDKGKGQSNDPCTNTVVSKDNMPYTGHCNSILGDDEFSEGILPSKPTLNLCKVRDLKDVPEGLSLKEGWSIVGPPSMDDWSTSSDQGEEMQPLDPFLVSNSVPAVKQQDQIQDETSKTVSSGSTASLPDRKLYIPPKKSRDFQLSLRSPADGHRNFEQTLIDYSKELLLKEGSMSFSRLIYSYRMRYPSSSFVDKDFFKCHPEIFQCTFRKQTLFISLGHSFTKSDSHLEYGKKGNRDTSFSYSQTCSSASRNRCGSFQDRQGNCSSNHGKVTTLQASSSHDREIIVKKVLEILKGRKRMRCSDLQKIRSLERLLRPGEILDRAFFLRNSSTFKLEELRHKNREHDFYAFVNEQSSTCGNMSVTPLNATECWDNCDIARKQDRSPSPSHRARNSPYAAGIDGGEGVNSLSEVVGSAKTRDKEKKKNKRKKGSGWGSSRRLGGKGHGSHRGEPIYVYGSGLPFYCSKADSGGGGDASAM